MEIFSLSSFVKGPGREVDVPDVGSKVDWWQQQRRWRHQLTNWNWGDALHTTLEASLPARSLSSRANDEPLEFLEDFVYRQMRATQAAVIGRSNGLVGAWADWPDSHWIYCRRVMDERAGTASTTILM